MTTAIADKLQAMASKLETTPHLLRLGALFSETVLIEIDDHEYYLTFEKGRVAAFNAGASRRTPWRFALRTDKDAIQQFWAFMPAPGFHDIFGLVKIGRGRIEGDILCLVKNLRFFKEFMVMGRQEETI